MTDISGSNNLDFPISRQIWLLHQVAYRSNAFSLATFWSTVWGNCCIFHTAIWRANTLFFKFQAIIKKIELARFLKWLIAFKYAGKKRKKAVHIRRFVSWKVWLWQPANRHYLCRDDKFVTKNVSWSMRMNQSQRSSTGSVKRGGSM